MPGLTAMEYQDAQRWTWSVGPWKQVAGCESHQERGGTATGGILQVSYVRPSKRKVVSVIDHSQWKHEVHEIIYYRIEFCDSSKKTKEYWKKKRKWCGTRKWKIPPQFFTEMAIFPTLSTESGPPFYLPFHPKRSWRLPLKLRSLPGKKK